MMLTPKGDKCVHKLDNCNVGHYEQPQDLTVNDELNQFECPQCMRGYWWNEHHDDAETQGQCEPCTIENCVDCSGEDFCEECSGDYFPSYLNDACQMEIEDCVTPWENYYNNGEDFVCPECEAGYYSLGSQCYECEIEGCTLCSDAHTCTQCDMPLILDPQGVDCIQPLAHCADEQQDYGIEDGMYVCNNCSIGYTWETYEENPLTEHNSCQPCRDVFEHCKDCRNNKCYLCDDGYFPDYDGHCGEVFEHCEDSLGSLAELGYGLDMNMEKRYCTECSEGFYWDWESWECIECRSRLDECFTCSNTTPEDLKYYQENSVICDSCDGGRML